MANAEWMPGSLFDNIDVFANSLGYENAAIAIHLAIQPWKSVEDRNQFIMTITQDDVRGGKQENFSYTKEG